MLAEKVQFGGIEIWLRFALAISIYTMNFIGSVLTSAIYMLKTLATGPTSPFALSVTFLSEILSNLKVLVLFDELQWP